MKVAPDNETVIFGMNGVKCLHEQEVLYVDLS